MGRKKQRRALTRDDLFARVQNAIGNRLSRDIAEDAAGDLYLAVLSGAIPIGEIEKRARTFGNRVLDRHANKFGPRSLNEELGDGEGFRMIDMLEDEFSSATTMTLELPVSTPSARRPA